MTIDADLRNKIDELNAQLSKQSLMCVVGARPNFMKIAPILGAFRHSAPHVPLSLVHTGQHYDQAMKDSFFSQLGIPEPDIDLGVGSGSHSWQTAEIMKRFEWVVDSTSPRAILVVGDVNSTIACALVAAKKQIPVIHVEAGLRSRDRSMPEEINRILTDQLSDYLYVTEKSAIQNLVNEGIDKERIHFVGNVMIDSLISNKKNAVEPAKTLEHYQTETSVELQNGYATLTLHRPSNVDDHNVLTQLVNTIIEISRQIPVVFTVHPRTDKVLRSGKLFTELQNAPNVVMLPPVGYLEMLGLNMQAKLVLTDSGGLQEETTALGVPCITLRENTERPITVEQGTNTVVGTDAKRILQVFHEIMESGGKSGRVPEGWDGDAAQRICKHILEYVFPEHNHKT